MQTLQRAFCQLRLVVSGTSAASKASCQTTLMLQRLGAASAGNNFQCAQTESKLTLFSRCFSSTSSVDSKTSEKEVKSYEPPSPYRNPGPRRFGYRPKFFTGGLLPRAEHEEPLKKLPAYKVKDSWSRKRALFGQNDYIDILGDGSLKPMDLLHGPDWLIGFKGNELQRLSRRMKFEGRKLSILYPTQYKNMKKRIWFLYKKYNRKRGKRIR